MFKWTLILLSYRALPMAQTQVVVNLQDGTVQGLDSLEKLQKGDHYKVEVNGVNLNLYRVVVEGTDTLTSKAVAFPTFAIPGLAELTTLSSNIGALATQVNSTIAPHNNNIMPNNLQYDSLLLSFKGEKEDQNQTNIIRIKLNEYAVIHDRYNDSLRVLRYCIDSILWKLKLRSLELRSVAPIAITGTSYDQFIAQLEHLRLRVANGQKVVLNGSKELSQFTALQPVKKLIGQHDDIEAFHKEVAEKLTVLVGKYDAAFATVNVTTMDPLLEQLKILDGNYGFSYCSIAFQYKGGEGRIKVSATPVNPAMNLPAYATTYRFPLKRKRYVGVSAAFYFSGMYNQAFSTITGVDLISNGDTTDGYLIKEEKVAKNEIGVAALFTYGWSIKSSNCGIHLTVGPAVSLADKVRPRLFTGVGLACGKEHLVLFNLGYLTGFSERRSVIYPDEGPYEGTSGSPTYSKLTGSWCVTLGYLFSL